MAVIKINNFLVFWKTLLAKRFDIRKYHFQ